MARRVGWVKKARQGGGELGKREEVACFDPNPNPLLRLRFLFNARIKA
jgi:hypothetical protein